MCKESEGDERHKKEMREKGELGHTRKKKREERRNVKERIREEG